MQGSLTTHSNIYRAISALRFSSFQLKASPEVLKIKKMRGEVRRGGCAIPMNVSQERSLLGKGAVIESKYSHVKPDWALAYATKLVKTFSLPVINIRRDRLFTG